MNPPGERDRHALLVAVAGPNGAGKTTFYHSHLERSGLRFVNADVVATTLGLDPHAAARIADAIRRALVERRKSFVFETVFSDPAGEKLAFLRGAAHASRCACRRVATTYQTRSCAPATREASRTSPRRRASCRRC